MDRDTLARYLIDGLSLTEIGARVGKHPSTVSYWIKKHDMRPQNRSRYARKGGLARAELERLAEMDLTLKEIAEQLSVSVSTVHYWLRKHGLREADSAGPRSERARAGRAAGLNVIELECRTHGVSEFVLEGRGYYRCRSCRKQRVAEWRRRTKLRLIAEADGSCVICGYDRCPGALHFHHLDPALKEFGLSARGLARGIDRIRKEAVKCVLLCSNCHAEVESGMVEPRTVLPHLGSAG